MITLLTTGFTIPYNPFNFELISPFFDDMISKISLGAAVGLAGFAIVSGVYILFGLLKGLIR